MAPSAAACVGETQPGPRGQIPVGGRAVPPQVPPRQLGPRRVEIDGGEGPEPLPHQDITLLGTDHRTPHDEPVDAGPKQDVDQRLSRGRDAGALEGGTEVLPGERAVRAEAAHDHLQRPLRRVSAHPAFGQAPPVRDARRRPRQRVQPRVVDRPDEMQRPPVEPGHQERTVTQRGIHRRPGEARGPDPNGEAEPPWVLGLDGQQALGHGRRFPGRRPGEQLRDAAAGEEPTGRRAPRHATGGW